MFLSSRGCVQLRSASEIASVLNFVPLGCRSSDEGWRDGSKMRNIPRVIRFDCSTGANASRYNFLLPTGVFFRAFL
jgi:hypothetical protein